MILSTLFALASSRRGLASFVSRMGNDMNNITKVAIKCEPVMTFRPAEQTIFDRSDRRAVWLIARHDNDPHVAYFVRAGSFSDWSVLLKVTYMEARR